MTGVQKLEHAQLRVTDLDASVDFYTEVMDLTELHRDDGTVYLGCGVDEYYDLAVKEGGTGVDHFAIRVDSAETLNDYEATLEDQGVRTTRTDGDEPGQKLSVQFDLPSGVTAELIVLKKPGYLHVTNTPKHVTGSGPVDLDHVTLATTDVEADATFLRDTLGWHISDVMEASDGEWSMAFTRYGDYHHDVGLFVCEEDAWTLNHLGWEFQSFDHMKVFADRLARHGTRLELGMNRHYVGDNLFAYFQEPGGNRFEITAEMATIDTNTPTDFHEAEQGTDEIIAAWGGIEAPESMDEGS